MESVYKGQILPNISVVSILRKCQIYCSFYGRILPNISVVSISQKMRGIFLFVHKSHTQSRILLITFLFDDSWQWAPEGYHWFRADGIRRVVSALRSPAVRALSHACLVILFWLPIGTGCGMPKNGGGGGGGVGGGLGGRRGRRRGKIF